MQVGDQLRHALEDLLLQHKVDLTLAGHVHSYYRSCTSVRHGRCPKDADTNSALGITHFVVGSAGHELSDVANDQPDWLAEALIDFGFLRMDVDGASMRVRFIRSEDGTVADQVELTAAVAPGLMCQDAKQG